MKTQLLQLLRTLIKGVSRKKELPKPATVSTRWMGTYTYGEEYPIDVAGSSVRFVIDMSIEDGIIKGVCTNHISETGFKNPATICGVIEDDTISFTKSYPTYTDFDDNNSFRIIKELPSSDICYKGTGVNGIYEGEWEIAGIYVDEKGELYETKSTGTWKMRKVKSTFFNRSLLPQRV